MTQLAQGAALTLSMQAATGKERWIHLVPAGTFNGRDGRGPYHLADASEVIRVSLAHAGKAGIVIDYDHSIDLAAPKGGAAPAAGWVTELEARADGLWGKVDWTPRAQQLVADREYRFISPALMADAAGVVRGVARASLTNNPNLTLVALNAAGATKDTLPMNPEFMAELLKLLGLPDTADAPTILAKIREAVTTTTTHAIDPARYVPMDVFQQTADELKRVHAGIALNAAEKVVDDAIAKRQLMPFMRGWAIDLCTANKPAFDKFLHSSKVPEFLAELVAPSRLEGKSPRSGGEAGAGREAFATLGISAEDEAKYGSMTK